MSVLSDLVATMIPETWAELATNGLTTELLNDGSVSNYILQWAEGAVWLNGTLYFVGTSHSGNPPSGFVTYDEATNTWTKEPDPWFFPLYYHTYDHNSHDGTYFYHRHLVHVYRYHIASQVWEELPPPIVDGWSIRSVGTGAGCFPDRNMYYIIDGEWGVYAYDLSTGLGGTWDVVANTRQPGSAPGPLHPMGSYNNFCEYNPMHKLFLFGGGQGSSAIYGIQADGSIVTYAPCPLGLNNGDSNLVYDPASGNFLTFFDSRDVYEFDPIADTWTLLDIPDAPWLDTSPDGPIFGMVATPAIEHGVTLYLTYGYNPAPTFSVYKHAASVPDVTPPGAPTVPSVSGTKLAWVHPGDQDIALFRLQWTDPGGVEREHIEPNGSAGSTWIANLLPGDYVFWILAEDFAGNQSSSVAFPVVTIPPAG